MISAPPDPLGAVLNIFKYGASGVVVFFGQEVIKALDRRREESSAVRVAKINAGVEVDKLFVQRIADLEKTQVDLLAQNAQNAEQIRDLTKQLYSVRMLNDALTARSVSDHAVINDLRAKLVQAEKELVAARHLLSVREGQLIASGVIPATGSPHGEAPASHGEATEGPRPTDGATLTLIDTSHGTSQENR